MCYDERSNLRCSVFLFLKINSPFVPFVLVTNRIVGFTGRTKKNSTTVVMGDQVTVINLEDNSLSWTEERIPLRSI